VVLIEGVHVPAQVRVLEAALGPEKILALRNSFGIPRDMKRTAAIRCVRRLSFIVGSDPSKFAFSVITSSHARSSCDSV